MESVWTQTACLPRFEPLEGSRKTDVLVIGGGITGILCAWMLRQAGADCLLIESNRLCPAPGVLSQLIRTAFAAAPPGAPPGKSHPSMA